MKISENNIKNQQLQNVTNFLLKPIKTNRLIDKFKETSEIVQPSKIEEEICKNKLKDILRMKDELQKKLMSLNENEALINTEFQTSMKIKKDKDYYSLSKKERRFLKEELHKKQHEAFEFVKNLKQDEKERLKRQKERFKKEQEKLKKEQEEKEKTEKEKINKERLERKENALKYIEELKQRREEEDKKRKELEEKPKPSSASYLYRKFEENYKNSILLPLLEDKKQKLAEKRNLLKPITKEELEEHAKKTEEIKIKHEEERKNEILKKKEQEEQVAEMLRKFKTRISQQIYERDIQKKEEKIKKIELRKSLEEKRKQYAESLKEECPVIPSEKKAKELKSLIEHLKQPVKEKRDVRKQYVVSELYKRRESSRSAHGELNTKSEENHAEIILKRNKRFTPKHDSLIHKTEDKISDEIKKKIEEAKNKKSDYLAELRKQREEKYKLSKPGRYNWSSDVINNKLSPAEKRERIERKAKMIEEKAKQNEKLFYIKGGVDKNVEMGEYVTDMFLDAIKAKLSILESI